MRAFNRLSDVVLRSHLQCMASRKRSYTKNEVLAILNNSEMQTDSDSQLDSSIDSNESDDSAEAEATAIVTLQ